MRAQPKPDGESRPFQMSVRIRHPSLDPDELSLAFKIEPEHAFRAGSPRSSGSRVTPPSLHPHSYWLGVLPPTSSRLDMSFPGSRSPHIAQQALIEGHRHLGWALSLGAAAFLKTHTALLQRIRSEDGDVTLLITIDPEAMSTFTLAPEVSRLFGQLGVAVEFEFADPEG